MHDGLRIKDLLQEERRLVGSIERLRGKLGVSDKTVQDWLKKTEDELHRLHPDNIDQIVRVALELGLEPERFRVGPSLWNVSASYESNLESLVPAAPQPLRSFLQHGINFLGYQLNSPVGVGASVFTANASRVNFWAEGGADLITYKTVRSYESPALFPPNIYFGKAASPMLASPQVSGVEVEVSGASDPGLALNGVTSLFLGASRAPDIWQADFREAQQHMKHGQLLVLSVLGGRLDADSEQAVTDDWARVTELGVAAGAAVLELNVSYPACNTVRSLQDPKTAHKICKAIRGSAKTVKLLLKIGPLSGETLRALVLSTVGEGLCDGVTAINGAVARPFYIGPLGRQPLFDGKDTCLGGRPVLGLGLDCVHRLAQIRERDGLKGMGIVGTGGVTHKADFMAYVHAGADVVQVASACFYNSYVPFQLRREYDEEVRKSGRAEEMEQEATLINFAKAARSMEQAEGVTLQGQERIMAAAQEEMLVWMRRPMKQAELGPLRPLKAKSAPTVEDCIRLIRIRLTQR